MRTLEKLSHPRKAGGEDIYRRRVPAIIRCRVRHGRTANLLIELEATCHTEIVHWAYSLHSYNHRRALHTQLSVLKYRRKLSEGQTSSELAKARQDQRVKKRGGCEVAELLFEQRRQILLY